MILEFKKKFSKANWFLRIIFNTFSSTRILNKRILPHLFILQEVNGGFTFIIIGLFVSNFRVGYENVMNTNRQRIFNIFHLKQKQ